MPQVYKSIIALNFVAFSFESNAWSEKTIPDNGSSAI
jgi:hypothetical protein